MSNKGNIKRICNNCGKEFTTYKAWEKRGNGKFCSRRCSGIWTAKNLIKFKDTYIEIAMEQELIILFIIFMLLIQAIKS